MKAQIVKIIPRKKSRSEKSGNFFTVIFKGEDGKSLVTYLDDSFRNWANWKGLMEVGRRVSGLALKQNGVVDADSPVKPEQTEDEKAEEFCKNYL